MPINCARLGRSRNIIAASSTAAGPCAWISTPLTTALVMLNPAITSTSGSAVPNTPRTSRLPQMAHEAGGSNGTPCDEQQEGNQQAAAAEGETGKQDRTEDAGEQFRQHDAQPKETRRHT